MKKTYHGSCHCGAIRLEADVNFDEGIRKCNCSFCRKMGYEKALVPYEAVRIVAGKDEMRDYRARRGGALVRGRHSMNLKHGPCHDR